MVRFSIGFGRNGYVPCTLWVPAVVSRGTVLTATVDGRVLACRQANGTVTRDIRFRRESGRQDGRVPLGVTELFLRSSPDVLRMPTGPGVSFVTVLNGAILILGLLACGYWLKTRSGETDSREKKAENWRQEALSLTHEVQQVAASSNRVVDPDPVRRQLLPLASRIESHVRTAPAGVDSRLLREFYDLGQDCYSISMEHVESDALESGVFFEDKLAAIQSIAANAETTIVSEIKQD